MRRLLQGRVYDTVICLSLLAAVAALVVFPQDTVTAAKNGLNLCLNVIIPSLFPFFVLSALTVRLGVARRFGRVLEPVMRPLFNVGGTCSTAFVLGFIGGYPVGAKTVINLYENGACTKTEAERMLSFSNNSGPAFIFGVVGAGIFSSSSVGLLLYLVHTLASVCVGLVFRFWGRDRDKRRSAALKAPGAPAPPSSKFTEAFVEAVTSSFQTTLNICGFVIFFTVFIKLLFLSGFVPLIASGIGALFAPFGFDKVWAERLLTGFIELTSGVWSLSGAAGSLPQSMAMAAFMLGWAGLSVHCQVLSFIGSSGLSVRTYICGKFLQASLSAVFAYFISRVFVLKAATAVYYAEQVKSYAAVDFVSALLTALCGCGLLIVLFVSVARRSAARRKRRIVR